MPGWLSAGLGGLPIDGLTMTEKAATGAVRWQGCCPDNAFSAFKKMENLIKIGSNLEHIDDNIAGLKDWEKERKFRRNAKIQR